MPIIKSIKDTKTIKGKAGAHMDRMEDFPVEVKIRFLAAEVFAAADLGMWCFSMDRELYYSTCPNQKEFQSFLELSECLDFVYERKEGWDRPVYLSDSLGLIWVAEHIFREGSPELLIVMGPVFLSTTSVKHIEDTLRKNESSVYVCRQMMRTLTDVPVIMLPMLNQFAKMLHYTITSERIQASEFIFQNEQAEGRIFEDNNALTLEDPDRGVKGERMLLQAVKDGNLNYKQIMEEEMAAGGVLVSDTGNALRDGKNTVLIFNALLCRAAMEGGIPAKIAKETEAKYILESEKCDTITKLKNVNEKMLDEYVRRVHDCKQNPMISKTTQECCDYIKANVLRPLTVESIARDMGYTAYYFTKKFHKEMGIRVTDYIKQARIDYAKIALLTTKKSIQEISDSLQFGTRNYFSKVFHDIVGMTPAAYRERSGKEGK